MTVVQLRPNGSGNYNATVTGAANIHAALSDNTDASYANTGAETAWYQASFGTTAIPAGAITTSVVYKLRCGLSTPTSKNYLIYWNSNYQSKTIDWTTPTTITLWSLVAADFGGAITQSNIDDLYLTVFGSGTGAVVVLRSYEAYIDVTYVAKPVTAPSTTGTITNTNSPLIQWNNSLDSDGGSQTKYEVKIFSEAQYTAGGFDPATSLPLYTSGEVSSALAYYQTPGVLSNGLFRAYVRVAQTVGGTLHRSDWAYSTFTIAYVEPVVEDQRSHTAQVASPVFRRTSIKPLALDFSWSDGTSFLPWTINGNQYPPTVQKDGVSRPGTDANYAVVAASNNIAMTFTATAAMPAGTLIREYKWDWGDGQVGYGPVAVHEYKIASPETRVSLTITDSNGNSWSRSKLLNLKYANRSVVRVYEVRNP